MRIKAWHFTSNLTICPTACSEWQQRHYKVLHLVPLWGESTSHWRIPLTKGQDCGKRLCVITSSYKQKDRKGISRVLDPFCFMRYKNMDKQHWGEYDSPHTSSVSSYPCIMDSAPVLMGKMPYLTNPPCNYDRGEYLWLTHSGRDKMATISQTTYSNGFSWIQMFEFWLKFHWSFFPQGQFTDAYTRHSAWMT